MHAPLTISPWVLFRRTVLLYLAGFAYAFAASFAEYGGWIQGIDPLLLYFPTPLAIFVAKGYALLWVARVAWGLGARHQITAVGRGAILIASLALLLFFVIIDFGDYLSPYFDAVEVVLDKKIWQVSLYACASFVLLSYKAAVSLEEAEGQHAMRRRFGNWLAFVLFPAGLWWLQPRINRALRVERGYAIEEHLID